MSKKIRTILYKKEWVAVDLDKTIAEWHCWGEHTHIGKPIPKMIERVQKWLKEGILVKIFTARVDCDDEYQLIETVLAIQLWCKKHIGVVLPITNKKDYAMTQLWDDRCIQVIENTGETVEEHHNAKAKAN